MKKIILVLFLLIFLSACTSSVAPTPSRSEVGPLPSPTPALAQFGAYRYAWVKLDNLTNLRLLPNHAAQASSEDLAKTNHCQVLVNGNFYDKQDKPLGWLVSQGKTLSQPIASSLFNGFLSLSTSKVEISPSVPQGSVDLGLQSGPLLIFDSQPLLLKISQDHPRRRVIAALNDQNQLIFLVITGVDSLFSGPLLADTPKLVVALGQAINQNLGVALNLDGGSASAFITPEVQLPEYSYIGSFFCYN
ncbi:MAG: phosphodiester glycosidase family protein [Candidatus Beckwithbacteria bacterium]|nr:phosphodiester glycosidase family protein [Candidatus Beckwithbacteria bacterium]